MKQLIVLAGLLPFIVATPLRAQNEAPPSPAQALEQSFVSAIAKAEKSVVSIARIKRASRNVESPTNPFGIDLGDENDGLSSDSPESPNYIPNDFGAGIVIAPVGNPAARYILTNYHVVRGGMRTQPPDGTDDRFEYDLYVRFADRRGCPARIFSADPRSDLAVLQIDCNSASLLRRWGYLEKRANCSGFGESVRNCA
jgi:S1-C subfamily serine protease